MKVAIVKYNAGNVQSVTYALNRLGIEPIITDSPEELASADKVIFPGVGEASTAMNYLKANGLDKHLKELHQPFLGICLGLQLMCNHSEEGDTPCLGIFDDVEVKRFPQGKKVPQIGWNRLFDTQSELFHGFDHEEFVYFVHSYYAELSTHTIAKSDYMVNFSAALQKDNYYAAQFHPEKSGSVGAKILENFIKFVK